jgi:acetyltransferase-like isoleucine patch superfamily enzyme
MAPSLLTRAIRTATSAREKCRSLLARHYFHAILGSTSGPYKIDLDVEIRNPNQVKVGPHTVVKRGTILNGRSTENEFGLIFGPETYIKEYCYLDSYGGLIEIAGPCAIGQFCTLHGGGGLRIGRFVMFGAHCYVIASNHNFDSLELPYILQGDRARGITIEDNVWIGGGSILLDGIRIGRNSVIGAGAIVTRNVPANSIYTDRAPHLIKARLHRRDRNP